MPTTTPMKTLGLSLTLPAYFFDALAEELKYVSNETQSQDVFIVEYMKHLLVEHVKPVIAQRLANRKNAERVAEETAIMTAISN
jgi:hypothetical protein